MEGLKALLLAPSNSSMKGSFSSMVLSKIFAPGAIINFVAAAYYNMGLLKYKPLTFSQTSLVMKGGSITTMSK